MNMKSHQDGDVPAADGVANMNPSNSFTGVPTTTTAVPPQQAVPSSHDGMNINNMYPTSHGNQILNLHQVQQPIPIEFGSTKNGKGRSWQRGFASNEVNGKGSKPNLKQQMKVPPTKKDNRKLFVGGLPTGVNDEEFRSFFEQFGTVIDSIVMIDRETKRSRGFGFITFQDAEVAKSVLTFGNEGKEAPPEGHRSGKINIRGKFCEVKVSEPKVASSGYQSPPINQSSADSGNKNRSTYKQRHVNVPHNADAYEKPINSVSVNSNGEGSIYGYSEYPTQQSQMEVSPYHTHTHSREQNYFQQYYPHMTNYSAPAGDTIPNPMMHGYSYQTYMDYQIHPMYFQHQMMHYDDYAPVQSSMNSNGSFNVGHMPDESTD